LSTSGVYSAAILSPSAASSSATITG
jgi:hypothetical protein